MVRTDILTARSIRPTAKGLVIVLEGREVQVPWPRCSGQVAKATTAQRMDCRLSPGGYGVHWPQIDEDVSVGGLVAAAEA
jgi:hypothetical protein